VARRRFRFGLGPYYYVTTTARIDYAEAIEPGWTFGSTKVGAAAAFL